MTDDLFVNVTFSFVIARNVFQTESRSDIRVVTYNTPLYYANGDLFMKSVYRTTGAHPEKLRKALKRIQLSTKVQVSGFL